MDIKQSPKRNPFLDTNDAIAGSLQQVQLLKCDVTQNTTSDKEKCVNTRLCEIVDWFVKYR